jgi:hypothetical protein
VLIAERPDDALRVASDFGKLVVVTGSLHLAGELRAELP